MPTRTFPKHFENLNQEWRSCVLCGSTSTSPAIPYGEEDTPDAIVGGCMYPESRLIKRDGNYYCTEHYIFRFRKKDMDDEIIDAEEPEGTNE